MSGERMRLGENGRSEKFSDRVNRNIDAGVQTGKCFSVPISKLVFLRTDHECEIRNKTKAIYIIIVCHNFSYIFLSSIPIPVKRYILDTCRRLVELKISQL